MFAVLVVCSLCCGEWLPARVRVGGEILMASASYCCRNQNVIMKLDIASSVLASLLLVDPALAATQLRQKKERVLDSDELEELEGVNKEYHNQFHHRMDEPSQKDEIHRHDGRKKKERVMDSTQLMDMEGTNKELHRVHARNKDKQTVASSHKIVLKTSNPEILADPQVQQALNATETVSPPDVGILSPDFSSNATVARNLQRRKKRRPRSCFQEIPAILRKADSKFTASYCDNTEGAMAYWNIKDDKSFFFGGYCDCTKECSKRRTTHCCGKGCLQCGGGSKFQKCGQFTKN